jgi:protease secretion system outer membrane protein
MDFSTSRRIARLGAFAIACAWPGAAGAICLVQAYEAALKNDPQYRAAWYEHEGGKEYANIGRAALLPSVAASYSASKNRARIE